MDALTLARFCQASYSHPDVPGHVAFDAAGIQGFIAGTEWGVALVFRGSDQPSDWSTNLNAERATMPMFGGTVHEGFGRAAMAARRVVLECLSPFPTEHLYIAGHSLGGAMATLFGKMLEDLQPLVYTYGSPRVLCGDAASAYRTKTFRYVHGYDIVPRVPSAWRGFIHVGDTCHLGEGKYARHVYWPTLEGWRDHSIAKYVAALEQQAEDSSLP